MLARLLPVSLVLLGVLGMACQPKPTDIPGPTKKWKEMNFDERGIWMAEVVLPHMTTTFQDFDPELFATVDCSTCHRSGVENGTFAMPDPALPKLSRHFREEHMKKHPETVRFMWEKVEPEMSALLGGPKGLPGFNCRNCHMVRK